MLRSTRGCDSLASRYDAASLAQTQAQLDLTSGFQTPQKEVSQGAGNSQRWESGRRAALSFPFPAVHCRITAAPHLITCTGHNPLSLSATTLAGHLVKGRLWLMHGALSHTIFPLAAAAASSAVASVRCLLHHELPVHIIGFAYT